MPQWRARFHTIPFSTADPPILSRPSPLTTADPHILSRTSQQPGPKPTAMKNRTSQQPAPYKHPVPPAGRGLKPPTDQHKRTSQQPSSPIQNMLTAAQKNTALLGKKLKPCFLSKLRHTLSIVLPHTCRTPLSFKVTATAAAHNWSILESHDRDLPFVLHTPTLSYRPATSSAPPRSSHPPCPPILFGNTLPLL